MGSLVRIHKKDHTQLDTIEHSSVTETLKLDKQQLQFFSESIVRVEVISIRVIAVV